jgi:hypothetical protein
LVLVQVLMVEAAQVQEAEPLYAVNFEQQVAVVVAHTLVAE